ncbi:unnamed protein product [Caenorhabditis brenneri]
MIFQERPMKLAMLLLWILFPSIAIAADCPACPVGGIWSEWTTTETCARSCGACANATYTRTCLSTELGNCPCSGDPSAKKPCNTQACNYPRVNGPEAPCCVGTPMVINNLYHCGPLEVKNTSAYCCPTGGKWTEWTAWAKVDGRIEYNRNRKCLSSGFNCPCDGESTESKFECPCAPLKTMKIDADNGNNICTHNKTTWDKRDPQFHSESCSATFLLETSDFMRSFYFHNISQDTSSPMVTTIGYLNATGHCIKDRVKTYDETIPQTDGEFQAMEFECDVQTGLWNGKNDNIKGISAIGQFYVPE